MDKIRNAVHPDNSSLRTSHAERLLSILRRAALRYQVADHPSADLFAAIVGRPALSKRPRPDRTDATRRAAAYAHAAAAGQMLVSYPAEVLRGLIAGIEEAAHEQLAEAA